MSSCLAAASVRSLACRYCCRCCPEAVPTGEGFFSAPQRIKTSDITRVRSTLAQVLAGWTAWCQCGGVADGIQTRNLAYSLQRDRLQPASRCATAPARAGRVQPARIQSPKPIRIPTVVIIWRTNRMQHLCASTVLTIHGSNCFGVQAIGRWPSYR